jgi:hypothetical protein
VLLSRDFLRPDFREIIASLVVLWVVSEQPAIGETEGQLPGMPPSFELRLEAVGESVVVSYGGRALAVYESGDQGMRNLAIVSLTRAGVPGVEVAALFGIRPEHVSRLRRHAAEGGARALLPARGRPAKLDAGGIAKVYELSDRGVGGSEIARVLGVSATMISRLLARRPAPRAERLELGEIDSAPATGIDQVTVPDGAESAGAGVTVPVEVVGARVGEGGGRSVYAGAMLLHPFLEKVGADAALGALGSGPERCYDTTAVALCGVFAFALGTSSLEGSKHLQLADAGLLAGIERFPHLRTLRPRLGALADSADLLQVQVVFAKAMLDADSEPPSVFFVDEHFVAYTGSRPVSKGWNTRRRHAEPGRHETVIVDHRWRAVCFASGPPQGLCGGMLDPVDQLLAICDGRALTIGFDRGGAYPKTFCELRDRGIDWVTYRRAPLTVPTVTPRRSWVQVDSERRYVRIADERVEIDGYGECRQLSVYEHGRVVLQILTSDLSTPAARLAHTLRCRWCIENTFKYLEDHHGLHWLCDYQMEITPDTTLVKNPERVTALAQLRAHEQTVAELEQKIGQHTTTISSNAAGTNPAETLCMLQADLHTARHDTLAAKTALKPIPAKLPANMIDPHAQRATPRVNRRALQTVLRLLAYNAELDLARAINTYLADPDEYRTITRHLLHQPGQIDYTPTRITVTIDEPHAPRIAHALKLLIEQINHNPPKLAGDHRPITYQINAKPLTSGAALLPEI